MAVGGRDLMTGRLRVPLIALSVALAAGAVAGFRYLRSDASAEPGSLGGLATIVRNHRLAKARLTGGFAYAPCRGIDSASNELVRGFACDGPPAKSWAATKKFREFTGTIRGASNSSARLDVHTTGVWKLIWDQTEDAVADLRAAAKVRPPDARVFNDLAVALTRFAQQYKDPSALVDAFIAVDSAVRLDTSLVEARFTHALVLENLYLRTDAIEAWNRYLRLDSRSRWADEARQHLAALEPQGDKFKRDEERLRRAVAASDSPAVTSAIAASPSNVRLTIHSELAAWGAAFARGDSAGARAHLSFARAVAAPFRTVTGDALLFDAVATIDQALAKRSADARALADGHVELVNGIQHLEVRDANASRELGNALRLLSSANSPMRQWALLFIARAENTKPESFAYLTTIRDSAPAPYVALRSSAAQYRGLFYDTRADYLHALAAYDSALAENGRTAEPGVLLRAGSWKAYDEDLLRGREVGWRTRYAALAAIPLHPENYQALVSVYDYASRATENDAPGLSLLYADEAIRLARRLTGPPGAYTLRRRAELLARVSRTAEAKAVIQEALSAARGSPQHESKSGRKLIADIMLADAHITLYSAPADVEPKVHEVVDEYKAAEYEKGLSPAYLYLAQSRAATGKIDGARAAFDTATSLMQQQRASIGGYAERAAFLDAARSVIDQTVAFHAKHKPIDAFEFFEGNRSRVLLEQLADKPEQTSDRQPVLAALRRHLTKDDVVLSYAVLPNELLIWVVRRNGLEQHSVPVAASELEELVDSFQRALRGDYEQPSDSSASARLYRLLIASAGSLQRGANLFVIPDRWLHFVPFVALQDPASGRYLVRDHAVSYAPSATLLLSNLARPAQRFSQASRVLAVGNPAFDQRAFSLPPLPAAESEASRIASLYAVHNPLTGREATDSTFQRMAPGFDILHFAGHAVVGRNAPQLSHLVLAPEARSDGAVFSSEIARWKLPRTRLVVLSGCRTADGKLSGTEGASSLARAFFTAGVPAVVSSLWAIEDDDTADFFVAFHGRLVKGDSPAVALRETQIEWLGDGRTPAHPIRSWAAFQLFGG
jgi:CHAT domain-containing protein